MRTLVASVQSLALAGLLSSALWAIAPPAVQAQPASLPDFTELVERVGPAVVNIRTLERPRANASGQELDPQLQEFMRRNGIPVPRNAPRQRGSNDDGLQQRGVGSGFVVSADGVVLTNAHVIDGADEVLVTLQDQREFKAKVLGTDPRTDVAVLKVEAAGLPVVKVGSVDQLKVGAWVVAIGSPFGLDNTVTAGIVSAKARDTGAFQRFIQTDVAINPGNSGGPLLNMRGEVVGINSRLLGNDPESPAYIGISFAIPIDDAMRVATELRTTGRVVRGRIGVQPDVVTKEVADAIKLPKAQGALIRRVESGSPAEKAGIEGGDVITKFDGKTVERFTDLARIVGATKPGTKASVQVFRNGNFRDLSVVVGELKEQASAGEGSEGKAPQGNAFGLTLGDVPAEQRKALKLRAGVRVERAEGPAARAGLREGDVIVAIDNTEVTQAKQATALLAKLDKAKVVSMKVRRDEESTIVLVRPAR